MTNEQMPPDPFMPEGVDLSNIPPHLRSLPDEPESDAGYVDEATIHPMGDTKNYRKEYLEWLQEVQERRVAELGLIGAQIDVRDSIFRIQVAVLIRTVMAGVEQNGINFDVACWREFSTFLDSVEAQMRMQKLLDGG